MPVAEAIDHVGMFLLGTGGHHRSRVIGSSDLDPRIQVTFSDRYYASVRFSGQVNASQLFVMYVLNT